MRIAVLFTLSWLLLLFYGGQVCPLMESLTLLQLGLPLATCFVGAAVARPYLLKGWVYRRPELDQSEWVFRIDFLLYAGVGSAISLYNLVIYDFPMGSGSKMIIASITLGLFVGLDGALEYDRQLMKRPHSGLKSGIKTFRQAYSLIHRFIGVAVATLVLVSMDLSLIILHDLSWLAEVGVDALGDARSAVITELFFVMGVLLLLCLNLLQSYARNLRQFFHNETQVLEGVSQGQLDRYVRVNSADEFGLIADHTNRMIDGLKERDHIKQVFGKMVSPPVARWLLAQGSDGLVPGGRRREVVVLFADIRDFTRWSETALPERVVLDLNRYFSEMVSIIHRRGGVVDKFIGDGLMAVFGLDDPVLAAARAVQAGREMLSGLKRIQGELSYPFEIGVGIHSGEVVAGLIGSPERLEFTFVGDVVNITARLEAMTRTLPSPLLVSGVVIEQLPAAERGLNWQNLGPRPLKGRQMLVPVFGLDE